MQKNSIIVGFGPEDMEKNEYRNLYKDKFNSLFATKKKAKEIDSVSAFYDELFLKKYVQKDAKMAVWDGPDKRHLYARDSMLDSAVYVDYLDETPFAEFRFLRDKSGKDLIRKDIEKFYEDLGFGFKTYELPEEQFSKIRNEMIEKKDFCIVCYTVKNGGYEARMLDESCNFRNSN